MTNQLVIIGTGKFAEIAVEYFSWHTAYCVVAVSVDSDFITSDTFKGRPVVPYHKLEYLYPPDMYNVYTAMGYGENNDLRTRFYKDLKQKGYTFATFISNHTFVGDGVTLGENNFIFEMNTIQPFVSLGNNNVIWSSNHIGHHSIIGDNNFISSEVCICGNVTIGNNCFIGVNSTLINDITIPDYTFIKACSMVKG